MPEASPQPAAGQAPQPPMGQSPATGATPNRGFEAQAMQRVGVVLKQLETLLPMAGAASELGKSVMKAINELSKHVQEGMVSPSAEKNALDAAQIRNVQNAQMQAQLRQQQAQGAQQQGPRPPQMPPMGAAA